MKKIGLGIQELADFKKYNFIYVDKTELIYKLIDDGKYYFLSRPRRFGKSLLVDTIKELFSGNKALFEGCWIYDTWDWAQKYPVIKLSFAEISYREHGLEKALELALAKLAAHHDIHLETESYGEQFLEVIQKIG
ncbi:MAG: AAA family ATPase, partial [Candidatus Electrothrix sp.]